MTEQLIYEINGERYILVEVPKIAKKHLIERANDLITKCGMIFQGVKEINRGGFFDTAVIIETYFLPEKNFDKWKESHQ